VPVVLFRQGVFDVPDAVQRRGQGEIMRLRHTTILTLAAVAAFSAPAFAKPTGPKPVIVAGCPTPASSRSAPK
jgi:hypothetical protein